MMMTRTEMIDDCIDHEIEVNFSDRSYVREVLMSGFKGFDDMSDVEVKEYWESIQEDRN